MEKFMKQALLMALKAEKIDEVPIGAVIVKDGVIIAKGYNKRESSQCATAHAEIIAINKACKKLNSWRLDGAEIYVTLEPCPMCAGALAWSQIGKVVYGASDPKRGFSQFTPSLMHPKTEVVSGILADECGNAVTEFFRSKR